MVDEIDRLTVQEIIELDDAARAAKAQREAAGGPSPDARTFDGDDLEPTAPSAETRRLRAYLHGLDEREQAQVLALYWAGRRILFAEPMDEATYRRLVAAARGNLEDAPSYLAGKSNLGEALRAAMAVLGAWAPRPGATGAAPG